MYEIEQRGEEGVQSGNVLPMVGLLVGSSASVIIEKLWKIFC